MAREFGMFVFLMPFVGHASEYEDCGTYTRDAEETRRAIQEDTIQEARDLLARTSRAT
jgi:hypothetical protein